MTDPIYNNEFYANEYTDGETYNDSHYTQEQLQEILVRYASAAGENLRDFVADCDMAGGFASFVADGAITLDMEDLGEFNGCRHYMLYHRTDGNLDPAVSFAFMDGRKPHVFPYCYESEVTGQFTDLRDDPGPHNVGRMAEMAEFLYNWTEAMHTYGYRYTPWKAVRK